MIISGFSFGFVDIYRTRISRPRRMPLSSEKVVKCVSSAMNVHSVITVNMIDPAETKRKSDSSPSNLIIEKQKRL